MTSTLVVVIGYFIVLIAVAQYFVHSKVKTITDFALAGRALPWTLVTLTLVLSFSGLEIITAFSAAVASLNNTGPGLGSVGPAGNYAGLNNFQTWACTFAMLLGRLEIFTLLVVLTPAFWKK